MPLSFKEFSSRPTRLVEYITHLEDLPLEQFMSAVANLSRYRADEKMDGANLLFGFDQRGRFFTSREAKGGKRYFAESDYPDVSAYDPFKAAHRALQKHEDALRMVLGNNARVAVEVLYGAQPNTVAYGRDGYNYVVFLRQLTPEGKTSTDQGKLDELERALGSEVTSVSTVSSDTADGTTLTRAPSVTNWKFARVQQVPSRKVRQVNVKSQLSKLEAYLSARNDGASEIMGSDLTNFDVLSSKKRELSREKQDVLDQVQQFKLGIKDEVIERLVKELTPTLGDAKTEGYRGVEGVVFFDPKTGEEFKVVDKKTFGAVNKFNYEVRNKVYSKRRNADPDSPLESKGGLYGDALTRIHRLFGIEGLTSPSTTKRTLEKFKGSTPDETVNNLINTLDQLNFGATRKKADAILTQTIEEIEDLLENFKRNSDRYTLELSGGQRVKYTREVKRRTLLTFAETLKRAEVMRDDVRQAKNLKALVRAVFGDRIKRMYETGEDED